MTLPNILTIFRILLVPAFITVLLYYNAAQDYLRHIALVIFLVAAVTDAVDGYIARKWNQKTKAGAILDPIADKLLLVSAFITLYKVGVDFPVIRFPVWLIVVFLSRDGIILIGGVILYIFYHKSVNTTFWGKGTTALQMFCILGMLLQLKASVVLWCAALVFAVVSVIDYLVKGVHLLNTLEPSARGAEDPGKPPEEKESS